MGVGYVSEAAEVAQITKAASGVGRGGRSVLGLGSRLIGCLRGSGRARGASRLPRFAQVSEAAVLLRGSGVLRDSLVRRGCFGGLFADSGFGGRGFGGSARQTGQARVGRGAAFGNGFGRGNGLVGSLCGRLLCNRRFNNLRLRRGLRREKRVERALKTGLRAGRGDVVWRDRSFGIN